MHKGSHIVADGHKGSVHRRLRGVPPEVAGTEFPPFLHGGRGALLHLRPLVGPVAQKTGNTPCWVALDDHD